MMSKRQALKYVAGAMLGMTSLVAAAQSPAPFPSKTITMVVPYAPGGSSDTRARQVAAKMAVTLGQSIIVENRPGANGNIGTEYIAKAPADGHVIGIGNLAPLTVNKVLMAKVPFDPAIDLTPIGLIERGPLVLLVSADRSPIKNFQELASMAKSKPGSVNYASAGNGGAFHLAGELLEDALGAAMVHIPYRGGGPATTDLIAGTVNFMFDMVPASLPYTKASPPKARALAVAADKRLPQYPDVPTFAELGIKNFEVSNWFGLVAPKNTPAPVVAKLNDALNKALREPDLAERITSQGNIIGGGTPEQFAQFIAAERARWTKIVQDKKITAD